MQIINDINRLSPAFRKKFDPRWAEVKAKYPNAHVFETLRTQERQDWLYAQGRTRPGKIVTRTKKSNHADGNAVDIVFLDRNGNPTWSGPYDDLIEMAKKYRIRNLKPAETCHFEDDGTPFVEEKTPLTIAIRTQMKVSSQIWNLTQDPEIRRRMEENNNFFRRLGY